MPESLEPSRLSRLQTLRGMRLWNLTGALASVHSAVTTGAYTTGYALHLGATSAQIGLLSAAPSWGQMLQAVSPLLIERLQRRKTLCMIAFAFSYGMWLPVAFIPFLFADTLQPWALMACIALAGAAAALAAPASNSWMTDLVPGETRGRFVARQQSIIAAVGLATSLAAGVYLDLFPEQTRQTGFMTLFIGAVLFALGSVWNWSRVPEPAKARSGRASPSHLLTLPFRHARFRRLMTFIALRIFLAMIVGPFFMVYMLRTLGIPYSEIAVFAAIQTLTNIAMNPLWGYLADKFGYKPILSLCGLGLAFFPLWWVFVTLDNYWIAVPLLQIWGGVMSAGMPLAQFNLMIKTAPDANRTVYIGCYSAMTSAASALGATAGGVAAAWCATLTPLHVFGHTISDLQYLFLGGFLLRLVGVVFLERIHEEASLSPLTVIGQMRSRNPVMTLWNLIRMGRSSDPVVKARAARGLGETRSPLAVDELIVLLDDSDREVRREAARSLGEIGDERAVVPLLERISDPASDIANEAIEALGAIPSLLSLNILVTLLNDNRGSIRRSAVYALGRVADRRAQMALERLVEHEQNRSILLAATEVLSRMGNERVLPRLQQLLRESAPGVERKSIAQSISRLLGAPEACYRLLQADEMTRDALAARILSTARRRLTRWDINQTLDSAFYETQSNDALQAYEHQDYGVMVDLLYRVAERAIERFSTSARGTNAIAASMPGHDDAPPHGSPHTALFAHNAALRINHGFLEALRQTSADHPSTLEEAVLGLLAFERLVETLDELTD